MFSAEEVQEVFSALMKNAKVGERGNEREREEAGMAREGEKENEASREQVLADLMGYIKVGVDS